MLLTGNFQLTNQSFPTNAFEAAEFWYCRPNSCFVFIIKEKLSERGLSPESCLTICHLRASCS